MRVAVMDADIRVPIPIVDKPLIAVWRQRSNWTEALDKSAR